MKRLVEIKLNAYNLQFSLKISDICRNVWIARVSNFVTGLWTVCNYGKSFNHGCTWYYWHFVSCSYARIAKEKGSLNSTKYAYFLTNLILIFSSQIFRNHLVSFCNVEKINLTHWFDRLRKAVFIELSSPSWIGVGCLLVICKLNVPKFYSVAMKIKFG
jgi:hypothetical protein